MKTAISTYSPSVLIDIFVLILLYLVHKKANCKFVLYFVFDCRLQLSRPLTKNDTYSSSKVVCKCIQVNHKYM